jgi:predicted component of viral defense system (DUF524 family)
VDTSQIDLIAQLTASPGIRPIPHELRLRFAPATHYLYEWRDYYLECPGADRLYVGIMPARPVAGDVFHFRFENMLGLTTLRPFAGQQPLSPPIHVEVISPKFCEPGEHLNFFCTLLEDLFARAARLPFTYHGLTSRGVTESLRPPSPLFTLHFLRQYAPKLRMALAIIQAAPHRKLSDHPAFVPLAEVAEADADVLVSILHMSREWVPAHGFPLAERLGGHAPARVWQRRPEETLDTPENRFVLASLRQLLTAAEALPAQGWWPKVPMERQALVREATSLLRQAIFHPMFDEVGLMQWLPLTSQVLLRREGYRDLLELWQHFHRARRPLFASLQRAIEVRDIAALYEFWVFFTLVGEIAQLGNETPVIDLCLSDEHGLEWHTVAHFGVEGDLVYNRQLRGYSGPLRPDYTWVRDGRREVVLDAKFRLERQDLEVEQDEDTPQAVARRADLYKMHTYRDALGVRAAVAVYPGEESVFYDYRQKRLPEARLEDVLSGDLSGVGALALKPGA